MVFEKFHSRNKSEIKPFVEYVGRRRRGVKRTKRDVLPVISLSMNDLQNLYNIFQLRTKI